MFRIALSALTAKQREAGGTWWKCSRCDKVARIPEDRAERFVRSGTGRHLA